MLTGELLTINTQLEQIMQTLIPGDAKKSNQILTTATHSNQSSIKWQGIATERSKMRFMNDKLYRNNHYLGYDQTSIVSVLHVLLCKLSET